MDAATAPRSALAAVPADAWRALREGAVVAPLPEVGALRVTGPDRLDFVHGQLAHDVRGLPAGGARRALLLDARGQARAEVAVHRRAEDLHLAVEDGRLPLVEAHLRAHVVFDQVELRALPDRLAALTVQGPAAEAVLAALGWPVPDEGSFAAAPFEGASLLLVRRARSAPGGVDVHLLREALPAALAALAGAGATRTEAATLEPSRIAAGLPRAGLDAAGGALPQEAGLAELISTAKGCYLGQEIMARVEARGRLKRGLVGLRLEGAPPAGLPTGAALLAEGRRVGALGGAALHPELGAIALAVLRHDVADGAALGIEGAPGARARRVALPFG